MIVEVAIALEWLMSTLKADNALTALAVGGIHRGMAPPGTIAPWVIVSLMSAQNTLTMQAVRVMSQILWQIKVVGPASSMSTLVSAASEIDSQLKRTSGSTNDGLVLFCYQDQPLQQDELVDGVLYTNIGGLYRTAIQQM